MPGRQHRHRSPEQIALFLEGQKRKRRVWERHSREKHANERETKRAIARRLDRGLTVSLQKAGLRIVTVATLKKPPLYYIDIFGCVWLEDTRSAEQTITDWQRKRESAGKLNTY